MACSQLAGRTNLLSLPETVWCFWLDDTRPDLVARYGECESFYLSLPTIPGGLRLCTLTGTRCKAGPTHYCDGIPPAAPSPRQPLPWPPAPPARPPTPPPALPAACTPSWDFCLTGEGFGASANRIVRHDCDGDGQLDVLCEEAGGDYQRYLLGSSSSCGGRPACAVLNGACAACPSVPPRLPQSCTPPPSPPPASSGCCLVLIGDSITAGLGRESRCSHCTQHHSVHPDHSVHPPQCAPTIHSTHHTLHPPHTPWRNAPLLTVQAAGHHRWRYGGQRPLLDAGLLIVRPMPAPALTSSSGDC